MRLQVSQWIAAVVVGLCCAFLGARSLLVNVDAHARTSQAVRDFEGFQGSLALVGAISAERGLQTAFILSGTDAARVALRRSRDLTDRTVAQARAAFAPRAPANAGDEPVFAQVETLLEQGRSVADRFAELTSDQRTRSRFLGVVDAMFLAADAAQGIRDRVARAVVRNAAEIGADVFLGLNASDLREQASRMGSLVVLLLSDTNSDDADVRERLLRVLGRLAAIERNLGTLAGAVYHDSEVPRTLTAVDQGFYSTFLPRVQNLADGAETYRDGRISIASFVSLHIKEMKAIEDLRGAVAAAGMSALVSRRDGARQNVIIASGLTGLVCLVLLVNALLLRRSVFRPLMAARDQARALANGDLSEPDGAVESREFGPMLEALSAIRDDQRLRHELDQQQRQLADELRRLAETDKLTGLPNRRAIEAEATRALADADDRGLGLAVILFDLDNFKRVNDGYGHAVGDEVLQAVASVLKPDLPKNMLARFGGEEFLVLLEGVTLSEAAGRAEHLRRKLEQHRIGATHLTVTASFGIAYRAPDGGASWSDLVASADRHLYRAKRAGRNRVAFDVGLISLEKAA